MRNASIITNKLEQALEYLSNQELKLKPCITVLEDIILKKVREEDISLNDAFDMFCKLQAQYTDSILLITKMKEILDFKC